jgi:hypothetical protein
VAREKFEAQFRLYLWLNSIAALLDILQHDNPWFSLVVVHQEHRGKGLQMSLPKTVAQSFLRIVVVDQR